MSEPMIFEQCMDERGNISVRVSHDVQVLTCEEADRIEAEYKRMREENAKLRKQCARMSACISHIRKLGLNPSCGSCLDYMGECPIDDELQELGVESET